MIKKNKPSKCPNLSLLEELCYEILEEKKP